MVEENNNQPAEEPKAPEPQAPEPEKEPVIEAPHHSDTDQSLFMGILSYLSILVIIPFLTSKDNPFVKFHIKQGLVLLSIEVVLSVIMRMFWVFMPIVGILQLATLVLAIIGIVNVVQKQQKELPIVGHYAKYFNF